MQTTLPISTISGKITLGRSQTEDRVLDMFVSRPYLVASWRAGEPIIQGYGKTEFMAWNCARLYGDLDGTELYERLPGQDPVWQSKSGKRITIQHLMTVDD